MDKKAALSKPVDVIKDATKACKQAMSYVGVFSFFVNLLMLTVPLYMLQLFDRVLTGRSGDTLLYLTIIAIVALGTFALLDIARSRVMISVSRWIDNYLSPLALMRSPDDILQGRNYGSYALNDITHIRQFIASPSIFSLFDSPWVPVYLFVIFLLHPLLGVIACLGAVVLFTMGYLNQTVTNDPLREANQIAMKNQMRTDAAMRNAEVIQAMGMMPNIIKSWYTENEKVLDLQYKTSQKSSILVSTSKFLRLVLQLLMLGTGAYLVIANSLTPGAMIAGSILLGRALAPVEQAIGLWKQFLAAKQSYTRLQNHFNQPRYKRHAGIKLPDPVGKLEMSKVFYVPGTNEKPTVQNVNLEIDPGEFRIIIGPSAAGKSTIAKLLVGAWHPSAGDVRLDGADVYTWDRLDFGRHVGYLPQDVELFNGSVKENISRMGRPDDDAVIEAAKLAGVHDMILHFPNGYDTELQGTDFCLSGGQRQRIALARTVYRNPKILVLDEPNSNLDSDGEQALVKTLLEMKKRGATIVLISHRPNLLMLADSITILRNGMVQITGPRDEIIKKLHKSFDQDAIMGSLSRQGDTV